MTPSRRGCRCPSGCGIAADVVIGWTLSRVGGIAERHPYTPVPMAQGTVMVIGGAEDKVRDRVILGRFVALAGGEAAKIAVDDVAQ